MVNNNRGVINLLPGEIVKYSGSAKGAIVKNRAQGRISSYSGVSVRVAKGVSVSTGGGSSSIIYGDSLIESQGSLVVTNRRTVLVAMNYGFELYHEKISSTAMIASPPGFVITSGSQTHIVLTNKAPQIVDIIWANAEPRIDAVNQKILLKEQRLLEQKAQQEIVNQNKKSARQYNADNKYRSECLKNAYRVYDKEFILKRRNAIQNQQYERQSFESLHALPDRTVISKELEQKAKKSITGVFFWEVNKKRAEYVSENMERIYKEQLDKWNADRVDFENKQKEEERIFYQSISQKLRRYDLLMSGDKEAVLSSVEAALEKVELYYPYHVDIVNMSLDSAYIDIDLPEIESLPKSDATTDKEGTIVYHEKSQKEIRAGYVKLVFEYAIVIASAVFYGGPALQEVIVSGHTKRRSSEGMQKEEYIYSISFERDEMAKIDYKKVDAYNFCTLQCNSICFLLSNGLLKEIVPFKVPDFKDAEEVRSRVNSQDEKAKDTVFDDDREMNSPTASFIDEPETRAPETENEDDVDQLNNHRLRVIKPTPYIFADVGSKSISPEDYVLTKSRSLIADKALEIAKLEAPIRQDALIKKLLKCFDINANAAVQEATEKAIKAAKLKSTKYKGVVFLWLPEQDPKTYCGLRVSNVRSVDEICPQELKNAFIYALQKDEPLQKDELIKAASIVLGYKRLGNRLETVLSQGLQFSKSAGALQYNDKDKEYTLS